MHRQALPHRSGGLMSPGWREDALLLPTLWSLIDVTVSGPPFRPIPVQCYQWLWATVSFGRKEGPL